MVKLIVIQENLDFKLILNKAKLLFKVCNADEIIIVLNNNINYAEDYLFEISDEFFNINNVILMQDYYYDNYGNLSSLYTSLEYIDEEDFVCIFMPSDQTLKHDDSLRYLNKLELNILETKLKTLIY